MNKVIHRVVTGQVLPVTIETVDKLWIFSILVESVVFLIVDELRTRSIRVESIVFLDKIL
jgi:hypothetical protein